MNGENKQWEEADLSNSEREAGTQTTDGKERQTDRQIQAHMQLLRSPYPELNAETDSGHKGCTFDMSP